MLVGSGFALSGYAGHPDPWRVTAARLCLAVGSGFALSGYAGHPDPWRVGMVEQRGFEPLTPTLRT
jgi:hypothetical protein